MNLLIGDVLYYVRQMLPMCLFALLLLLLLRPARRRRLSARGLDSGPPREAALGVFVLFCAGLAALTLFPANFWNYVVTLGRAYPAQVTLWSFYPTWEETIAGLAWLPDVLTPFQEIRRALNSMSYWLMFMLLGNIVMFLPVGFFPPLLWRSWSGWKVALLGCITSCTIEFVQFFIGRSTDIDDVILNTAGAAAGYGLFWLFQGLCPGLISQFRCRPTKENRYGCAD